MKTSFILLLTTLLFSCGSAQTKTSEAQEWIDAQNFTVTKPEGWRAVKDHGYVSYTPIKGRYFHNAKVSVFPFQLKEKLDFKQFVQNQIDRAHAALKIVSEEKGTDKTQLGEVYIHKYESTWNDKTYKKYVVYFQQNGAYYHYNYSSLKENYETYFDEAISILKSFKLKKES